MTGSSDRQRRMELRRSVGNRKVNEFPVGTAVHRRRPYTRTYACLACRETRKRVVDWPDYPDRLPCPTCGGLAFWMSYRFRSPPKDDLKAWRVIEAVVAQGFRYSPVGEHYPTTIGEVDGFAARQADRRRPARTS